MMNTVEMIERLPV